VRNPGEWAKGHLAGATRIAVDDLRQGLAALPRGRRLWVHCKSGFRGHLAVRILKQAGFEDVVNVTGGWTSMLLEGGLPVETGG
jgi:rhodanese-related sulfurtransferase